MPGPGSMCVNSVSMLVCDWFVWWRVVCLMEAVRECACCWFLVWGCALSVSLQWEVSLLWWCHFECFLVSLWI